MSSSSFSFLCSYPTSPAILSLFLHAHFLFSLSLSSPPLSVVHFLLLFLYHSPSDYLLSSPFFLLPVLPHISSSFLLYHLHGIQLFLRLHQAVSSTVLAFFLSFNPPLFHKSFHFLIFSSFSFLHFRIFILFLCLLPSPWSSSSSNQHPHLPNVLLSNLSTLLLSFSHPLPLFLLWFYSTSFSFPLLLLLV